LTNFCLVNILLDIFFTGKEAVLPSKAISSEYITNFATLRAMGDALMSSLLKNAGITGSTTTDRKNTKNDDGEDECNDSALWLKFLSSSLLLFPFHLRTLALFISS
jgi:hypothetical protein